MKRWKINTQNKSNNNNNKHMLTIAPHEAKTVEATRFSWKIKL